MSPSPDTPLDRLMAHWVYGGALAGLLLLALAPLLTAGWHRAEILAFLALPAYMLHQYEEHDADRFRRFVNDTLAGGAEALTVAAVFWINIVGVWAVLAATLWLMRGLDPGWGVIAPWLLLVNAFAHLGQAIAMRRPNPGLWTGLAAFIPLGLATLTQLWPQTSPLQHGLALALVLAIHAAIFGSVRFGAKARP
jgi:hypothetical protein